MHTLAASSSSAPISIAFFLIGLAILGFNVWIAVIAIQFLRTGTQAFRRYLVLSGQPGRDPGSPPSARDVAGMPPGYH